MNSLAKKYFGIAALVVLPSVGECFECLLKNVELNPVDIKTIAKIRMTAFTDENGVNRVGIEFDKDVDGYLDGRIVFTEVKK